MFPKHLNANALVDCALVHTLRNFGNTGISDVSGSPHLSKESVSVEHHSMWMDLHTEGHETHQADRDQSMSHLCHKRNRTDHVTGVVLPFLRVERGFQLP